MIKRIVVFNRHAFEIDHNFYFEIYIYNLYTLIQILDFQANPQTYENINKLFST